MRAEQGPWIEGSVVCWTFVVFGTLSNQAARTAMADSSFTEDPRFQEYRYHRVTYCSRIVLCGDELDAIVLPRFKGHPAVTCMACSCLVIKDSNYKRYLREAALYV